MEMEENNYYNQAGKNLAGEPGTPNSGSQDFDDLKGIWNLSGGYQYAETAGNDKAWEKLKTEIQNKPVLRKSWIRVHAWAVAASFALLVAGAAGFVLWDRASHNVVAAVHEKTGNLEFKTLTLSDGTAVTLNSNSEITVAAGFNEINRNITLKGQAIFEVAKNKHLPFHVATEKTLTKVLGTGFDIKAYPAENVIIKVNHGIVKFSGGAESLILEKGSAARFNIQMGQLETIDASLQPVWNNGIEFNKATLADISVELKHRFGKGLKFDQKYAGKMFTGKFPANTSIEDIAKTLEKALSISIEIE